MGADLRIRHRGHVVITPHHKHADDAMMDYLLPRWHVAWRIGGVSKMLISPGMTDSAPAYTPVAEEIVAGIAVETDSLVPSSLISIEEFSTPFYGFASGIFRATQLVRIGNIARA